MPSVQPLQFNSIITPPIAEPEGCSLTKTAINAIKALSLLLMAAGTGCFLAGLQAPAIALIVMGIASLVLGFALNKNEQSDYLFLSCRAGRGQEGCCGGISVEKADAARQKLQEKATPGIFFDPAIYRNCHSIRGTCTAMSLEFASTYFDLWRELMDVSPGSKVFLDKLRLVSGRFEKSSEEMRSRQAAYSSITVDRTVDMDVSRSKVESCITYHDFGIDYCSSEMDITDIARLQQEVDSFSDGVYFIRMLQPGDNHKLEARGHSMIYVHEEGLRLFYDNNWGLEKIPTTNSATDGTLLCERLLNVHKQWDIPVVRFYRLNLRKVWLPKLPPPK